MRKYTFPCLFYSPHVPQAVATQANNLSQFDQNWSFESRREMSAPGKTGTSSAVQMLVTLTGLSISFGLHRGVFDTEAAAEQLRNP